MRAKLVPDRASADTQVIAHVPISQLRQMPGAPELADAWIKARLSEDGFMTGKDAEAAACDAATVPVVTGHADLRAVDKIIELALASRGREAPQLLRYRSPGSPSTSPQARSRAVTRRPSPTRNEPHRTGAPGLAARAVTAVDRGSPG